MRLLVVSSLAPLADHASGLILLRHLSTLSGVTLHLISEEETPLFPSTRLPTSRLLRRLENTRFHIWIRWFSLFYYRHRWKKIIRREIQMFQPQVILSLAHGLACFAVAPSAQSANIPLVLLFHDWWPDFTQWPRLARPWLDREFSALATPTFALGISPGMLQALGAPSRARLLYPIPDPQPPALSPPFPEHSRPTWIYTGSLCASYGAQIASLTMLTGNRSSYHFACYGKPPDIGTLKISDFATAYGGFLSRQELNDQLQQATGFIATMSFLPSERRKAETSFPSKITEYSRYGKPIVIWGPEYCSAVQWARATGGAECVTSPDPRCLAQTLERLSLNPIQRETLGQAAAEAYRTTFQPDLLQKIFTDTLQEAAASRSGTIKNSS